MSLVLFTLHKVKHNFVESGSNIFYFVEERFTAAFANSGFVCVNLTYKLCS